MVRSAPQRPATGSGETGIASAALVLVAGAVVNCGLALAASGRTWLGPFGAPAFFLLGLELAGMGITVALVALALGPGWRGPEPRRAYAAVAVGLAVLAIGLVRFLPRLVDLPIAR